MTIEPKRIAIIGAGNVGTALAKSFSSIGHEITFGVPETSLSKYRAKFADTALNATVSTNSDASADAEMIVLATPWNAAQSALEGCGDLQGKILIDCTNPLKADFSGLEFGHTFSGAEQVAQWSKGARVYKAFNHTGAETMENPKRFDSTKPALFICGDDRQGKVSVVELANAIGFEGVDAGPLLVARYLEPLAMLWINLAYTMGMGRNFAFALARC